MDNIQATSTKSITAIYYILTQASQAAVSVKIQTQPLVMSYWQESFNASAQFHCEKEGREAFLFCPDTRQ